MPSSQEKLAESLEYLQQFQDKDGVVVVKGKSLKRTHRERLLRNGFIKQVIRGWYISARPGERIGDTRSWYTTFWKFCEKYLNDKHGEEWCVSPEQSISILSGNWTVPNQLLIRSPKGGNNIIKLLTETSIFEIKLDLPDPNEIIEKNGIRLFSVSSALISCTPNFYLQRPTDIRIVLTSLSDASELIAKLLDNGKSVVAGRLAGAFRNIGKEKISENILKSMKAAGYEVRENDPFSNKISGQLIFSPSPYINRIRIMWRQMRETVLNNFPNPPGIPSDHNSFMKSVDDSYLSDAYHSLSIEGYRVSTDLIEKVKRGLWNPEANPEDKKQIDTLAARGYYLAFEKVKQSIVKVISGENPGVIVDEDHQEWYRQMFSPSVEAGIIAPSSLAGYRNNQVFISGSMHIPLNVSGVRDAMPTFFELLKEEEEAAIRAVLGHFMFVYIHPYMDGNGRIGRFLMNVMLASGGFHWTIIPLEKRKEYMEALEKASVKGDILDFTKLVATHIQRN